MTDTNKFPHKLNQWIEEEIDVPVMTPVVDEKKGTVTLEQTTKKMTQRTFYSDSTPRKIVCSNHEYLCLDKGKYLFKCIHCDWHRVAPPVTFRYDPETRILSYRETGLRV